MTMARSSTSSSRLALVTCALQLVCLHLTFGLYITSVWLREKLRASCMHVA